MATLVIMPRQGQSVESCVITEWAKKKGDKVAEGDVLFSYETDKSSFDETATVAGTLLEVFVEDGDKARRNGRGKDGVEKVARDAACGKKRR